MAADELVFFRDAHGLFDAFEHADFKVGNFLAVADDADDGAVLACRQMGFESCLMQTFLDFFDVFLRGIRFHDNDHNEFLPTLPEV